VLSSSLLTSVFILPLVGPLAAVLVLLAVGVRRQFAAALLALLVLVPAFLLAQCLLSAVGWCLGPLPPAAATPAYLPWYAELLLAPVCYLYLRVLGQQSLQQAGSWRHLLPGAGQVGLFAGIAVLGFGYRQVSQPAGGPASAALELLRHVVPPLALLSYGLLLLYGLKTLTSSRRNAPPWPPASPRTLVFLLVLGFSLGLGFVAAEVWFGPFTYSERWFAFAVRAGIVFGLAVVGLQASYALAAAAPGGPAAEAQRQYWRSLALASCAHPVVLASGTLGQAAPPVGTDLLPRAVPAIALDERAASAPPLALAADLLPWHARLLALMEQQQPWLEPELTLPQLAQRLGIHANQLSRLINTGCKQNFNDFVNGYRVAEARRLLTDPRFAHYSLVGVALASGFNSKSTFNRVFKKLTEQAPGEVQRPKV